MTISERAAGRGFVLGSEGLGFLAILTADVGFEVLWRLRQVMRWVIDRFTDNAR